MVWCVSWYNKQGERRIEWNVPDPWFLKEKLINNNTICLDLKYLETKNANK